MCVCQLEIVEGTACGGATGQCGRWHVPELNNRDLVNRWVKYFSWLIAFAVIYVLVDFTVDIRPPSVQSSYRFSVPDLKPNEPVYLHQDNLTIVLVLHAKQPGYFVAYALGTDLGCPLQTVGDKLVEICGTASYDLYGRALTDSDNYPNLKVPNHQFSSDFKILTIFP